MSTPIPMVSILDGTATEHVWPLPLDEAFLERLLRDLFENHHDKLTFGPIIPGAAYEMKAPGAPERVSCQGGYLTIHWGGKGHMHLCIGANRGPASNPNPPELIAHRRPSRAEFFRRLDQHDHPVSWGYRMWNGKGEPQITIFFANPFITDLDQLADEPDWSRLATWDTVIAEYAGHQPDGLDRLGKGFRGA